jgi:hypothetical protein
MWNLRAVVQISSSMLLIASAALVGFVLAGRYRFFVLVPVIVLLTAAAAVIGLAENAAPASTLLVAIGAATAAQLGYIAGSAARIALTGGNPGPARLGKRPRTPAGPRAATR